MPRKLNIFFLYPFSSTFILKDIMLLENHYNVKKLHYRGWRKDIFKIFKGILFSDLVFIWFARTHAFIAIILSLILRKKTILITGGYDIVRMPEINYGLKENTKLEQRTIFTLKHASMVFPFSRSSESDVRKLVSGDHIKTIYSGAIDFEKFKPEGKKEDIVITVGFVTESNLKRKGLETFVKAAKYLPKTQFILIGKHKDSSIDYLRSFAPSNVEFTGFISDEQLLKYYQRAKVYVQASGHEGFGVSLGEAMACECVPVTTRRGALPEVVGETGFYVPFDDSKLTSEAIKKALTSDKGKKARIRIVQLYNIKRREKELISEINKLFL